MIILGWPRPDDLDRFVWLRAFADLSLRAPALAASTAGLVWGGGASRSGERVDDRSRERAVPQARLGGWLLLDRDAHVVVSIISSRAGR